MIEFFFLVSFFNRSFMNKSEVILYNGKWLRLKAITYTTEEGGDEHVWEALERTTSRRARFDGLFLVFFFFFIFFTRSFQLLRLLHLFIHSVKRSFLKRKES